jgi:hypothetical protein
MPCIVCLIIWNLNIIVLILRYTILYLLLNFKILSDGLVWLSSQLILWIQYYCDILPDKNEHHAPIYYTIKDLHQDFCVDGGNKFNISGLLLYDGFRKFWHKFFNFVKFPDRNYLGKCDTCMEIKSMKSKSALSPANMEILRKMIQNHNILQSNERISYEQRKHLGVINSSEVLSLIMDAMRSKMLPHVFPVPKSLSSLLQLPTTIFGFLNHSLDSQMIILHHDH